MFETKKSRNRLFYVVWSFLMVLIFMGGNYLCGIPLQESIILLAKSSGIICGLLLLLWIINVVIEKQVKWIMKGK